MDCAIRDAIRGDRADGERRGPARFRRGLLAAVTALLAVGAAPTASVEAVEGGAIEYGARGGLCRSKLWGTDAAGIDWRNAFGGSIFLSYPLGEHVSLQPEIAFSMRGWVVEGPTGTFTARPTYIDCSLLARIDLPVESDLAYRLLGGLYAGYGVTAGGRFVPVAGPAVDREIADFSRVDGGLVLGAEIAVEPVSPDIVIGVRYHLGLLGPLETKSARTQSLVLSVGFSLRRRGAE